ncbi:hypothetical protein Ddc_15582 [Ditylenchus destructor]|nr:hypothetical protein Ddc_15582 [Ditylenchus destructor]
MSSWRNVRTRTLNFTRQAAEGTHFQTEAVRRLENGERAQGPVELEKNGVIFFGKFAKLAGFGDYWGLCVRPLVTKCPNSGAIISRSKASRVGHSRVVAYKCMPNDFVLGRPARDGHLRDFFFQKRHGKIDYTKIAECHTLKSPSSHK